MSSTIPGRPLSLEEFTAAAYGEREFYQNEAGEVVGYMTWFSGLYVCLTCGHLCDCGEEDEEEEQGLSWHQFAIELELILENYKRGEK